MKPEGLNVRCSRCNSVFMVTPDDAVPPRDSEAPPPSGARATTEPSSHPFAMSPGGRVMNDPFSQPLSTSPGGRIMTDPFALEPPSIPKPDSRAASELMGEVAEGKTSEASPPVTDPIVPIAEPEQSQAQAGLRAPAAWSSGQKRSRSRPNVAVPSISDFVAVGAKPRSDSSSKEPAPRPTTADPFRVLDAAVKATREQDAVAPPRPTTADPFRVLDAAVKATREQDAVKPRPTTADPFRVLDAAVKATREQDAISPSSAKLSRKEAMARAEAELAPPTHASDRLEDLLPPGGDDVPSVEPPKPEPAPPEVAQVAESFVREVSSRVEHVPLTRKRGSREDTSAIGRIALKRVSPVADSTEISSTALDTLVKGENVDTSYVVRAFAKPDPGSVLRASLVLGLVFVCMGGWLVYLAGWDVSRINGKFLLSAVGWGSVPLTEGAIADVESQDALVTTYRSRGQDLLVVTGKAVNRGATSLVGVQAIVLAVNDKTVVEERRAWLGVKLTPGDLDAAKTAQDLEKLADRAVAGAKSPPSQTVLEPGQMLDYMVVFPKKPEDVDKLAFRVEFRGKKEE